MNAADYEKLGVLYVGRRVSDDMTPTEEPILLDAKDLVTHGVIVGMTGSGKTGLGIVLLEEAAIDGIPCIAIDPKGDLTNLMLAFPDAGVEAFRAWAPPGESAEEISTRWREGMAASAQPVERVARFTSAVERVVFTPGSRCGVPLSVVQTLAAPRSGTEPVVAQERAVRLVSGLLALLGDDADPSQSATHTFLSTILVTLWSRGESVDLATLVRAVQQPPFDRIGVMDLETVMPGKARQSLALAINNLIASPAFARFIEGEPLDIARLLASPSGKPRLSVVSIAHLSESERMFFVTVLLGELLAWMRAQPGTPALRALLYMDEIFGFFPPVASPPAKEPMLTLLKQARAYGLGVVLSTQNPIDLDYKGLSNAGTWMLGRLQTERDKLRVLDGLESAQGGAHVDRAAIDRTLSSLPKRTFVLHSVHRPAATLFQTRWALSYLRGPLTLAQIESLPKPEAGGATAAADTAGAGAAVADAARVAPPGVPGDRPVLPTDVVELFIAARTDLAGPIVYTPGLLATAHVHYSDRKASVDLWATHTLVAPFGPQGPSFADAGVYANGAPPLVPAPETDARFDAPPAPALRKKSYNGWASSLALHIVRERPMVLYAVPALRLYSRPGETREAFAMRAELAAREARDAALEKVRAKYAPKLARITKQLSTAQNKVEREREQQAGQKLDTGFAIGDAVLGAIFGRRGSVVTKAGRVARGAQRASREAADVERAQRDLERLRGELEALEAEARAAAQAVAGQWDASHTIGEVAVAAKKKDVTVEQLALAWLPWIARAGWREPAWS